MLTIAGRRQPGQAGSYPVRNPVRPVEIVCQAPAASPAQLDAAVAGARAAAGAWAARSLEGRAELLIAAAAEAERVAAAADLPRLLTREHGKVLAEAQLELATIAGITRAYTALAAGALADERLANSAGATVVSREPQGVVAAILPFNWPVAVMLNKVVPALLAGNAVVVKTPPTCPATVLTVAAALSGALPDGVLNTVNGPGPELGEALVSHAGVDMVSLTGGGATGRRVMAAAGARLAPVVLELGGNDAAIVLPDFGIDEALARQLIDAAFVTSGQVCMAVKRVYVPAARRAEMVAALVAASEHTVAGDGLAPEVTLGPVHSDRGRRFAETLLADAESAGARVVRTGTVRAADAGSGGYLMRPAIVDGVEPGAAVVREEQFAPVLPVLAYRDLDDAVAQANDTQFGLCASVWSHDDDLAHTVARRLEAGTVFINAHGMLAMDPAAPFGGWKQSGLGRELGVEGIRAFTRSRTLVQRRAAGR
ncbi:MAG: aldehyde dehydrogenase family protein [Chloroflexi bacterium]|nr:MAG: aldehyde dehydrogenase family protein [Chloroflexota bacterium]